MTSEEANFENSETRASRTRIGTETRTSNFKFQKLLGGPRTRTAGTSTSCGGLVKALNTIGFWFSEKEVTWQVSKVMNINLVGTACIFSRIYSMFQFDFNQLLEMVHSFPLLVVTFKLCNLLFFLEKFTLL